MMITVSEVAAKWRLTEQRIRQYLAAGRIKGAYKHGRDWNIPARAKRPEKKRGSAAK